MANETHLYLCNYAWEHRRRHSGAEPDASNGSMQLLSVGLLLRDCTFCCCWLEGLQLCLDPIQGLVLVLANGLAELSSRLVISVGRISRNRSLQLLLRWPRRLVLSDPLLQAEFLGLQLRHPVQCLQSCCLCQKLRL